MNYAIKYRDYWDQGWTRLISAVDQAAALKQFLVENRGALVTVDSVELTN